jgi:NuA3 HAT complex component NTO1
MGGRHRAAPLILYPIHQQKRRSSGIIKSPSQKVKTQPPPKPPKVSQNTPIIPNNILDDVIEACKSSSSLSAAETSHLVIQICKYWSLKRQARSGAALLKRLVLEVFFLNDSHGANRNPRRNR